MTRYQLLALLSAAALTGCQTVAEKPALELGRASLQLADGRPAGTARLLSNGAEVSISIALANLTPGVHGVHLHMTGKCEGPAFTTAGGHLNPAGHQHGSANPAGAHLGDLPNATIGPAGSGTVSATLSGAPGEVMAALFDSDGSAVVVHADADDYRTDPSGNSGARIACGALVRG